MSDSRWLALALLTFCATSFLADEGSSDVTADELFHQRIMPIFKSKNPSSCVQCHLSSVDLKDYILPSHEETFLSLRDQGLINVDEPEHSKILDLIAMGERDLNRGAQLIHKRMRDREYEAFSSWVKACCADKELVRRKKGTAVAKPKATVEVIRHARKSRLVDSFERNVWSQRMRCFPCHTPHEIDPNNPMHKKPAQRYRELVKQYGQKINLFGRTPEESMQQMIVNSRKSSDERLPMLNLEDPTKSLLVLKPTAKLPQKLEDGSFAKPSFAEPVSHMGGLKMHLHDQSYKAFISWIKDYANVVDGSYVSVEDLPADNWHPSLVVLRMKDCPDDWPVGTPVQLLLYKRAGDGWSKTPFAFTQGTVTPRSIVNGAIFQISDEPLPSPIAAGEYRVEVRVDQQGKVVRDPSLLLDESDSKGFTTHRGQWIDGFRNAEIFSASDLR